MRFASIYLANDVSRLLSERLDFVWFQTQSNLDRQDLYDNQIAYRRLRRVQTQSELDGYVVWDHGR